MNGDGGRVVLSARLCAALSPRGELGAGGSGLVDDGDTVVVEVDSVERRYRDAIKAGAEAVESPRDDAGMGVWRRVARLRDVETDRPVTIWSARG